MIVGRKLWQLTNTSLRCAHLSSAIGTTQASQLRLFRGIANDFFPDGSKKRKRSAKRESQMAESPAQQEGPKTAFSKTKNRQVLSVAQATQNLHKVSQLISGKPARTRESSEMEGLEVDFPISPRSTSLNRAGNTVSPSTTQDTS